MKSTPDPRLQLYRVRHGPLASTDDMGNTGAFIIPGPERKPLSVIFSCDGGWEHLSVSLKNRCPTWEEMEFVKQIFFQEDEWAIQFHPAKEHYVNCHPYCLHIWKPIGVKFPFPPDRMVGLK